MGVTVLRLGQLPVGAGADMPPRSIKATVEATLGRHTFSFESGWGDSKILLKENPGI